ncbi:hypothetical protein HXX76_015186 [Chlamydomonas incerta]|uniref:Uncharacterized protein n=1 Tax=Chlamydomonas incerta TaxID=51695 RepID=A0A835SB20_CHLIN|nr:hypothetical protein HXX76_015186 [Chlamydomonas incerta]|eukprot:KAG2423669.1 hypothetical protein HXX76_015186 [Chlamydomonas incerta]
MTILPSLARSISVTAPSVLQIAKGSPATAFIPVAIPTPLTSFTCTLNVPAGFVGSQSAIGTYPSEVTVSTVAGGCQINWNNAARNLKDKMPVPIRVTAAPALAGATHRTDLDIILEVVDKTTAPVITATFGGQAIANNQLVKFNLNTVNTVFFKVTDPDVGATVYVASATIPTAYGATLTPLGPQASPL